MTAVASAAKHRVSEKEAWQSGGSHYKRWVRILAKAEFDTDHLGRLGRWRSWFGCSYSHALDQTRRDLASAGLTHTAIQNHAAGSDCRPFTRAQTKRSRDGLQRATTELLHAWTAHHPEVRMRKRLEKLGVPIYPRIRAQRAVLRARQLAKLTAPGSLLLF